MGVDGIGSGGRPPVGVGEGAAVQPGGVEVGARAPDAPVTGSAGPAAAGDLAAVDPAEMDRYLDARVSEATRHLEGALTNRRFLVK